MTNWMSGKSVRKVERKRKPNPGTHVVILDTYEEMETQDFGVVPKATFRIHESRTDTVGTECGDIWFVNNKGLEGEYSRGDAIDFLKAICACLNKSPNDFQAIGAQLLDKSQPGRGIALVCTAVASKSKKGNDVVNVSYAPIAHTPERIKAQREALELYKAGVMPAPAAQPVTTTVQEAAPAPVASSPPASGGSLLDSLGLK